MHALNNGLTAIKYIKICIFNCRYKLVINVVQPECYEYLSNRRQKEKKQNDSHNGKQTKTTTASDIA